MIGFKELSTATSSCIVAARVTHTMPINFRYVQYPDGRVVLQGGYPWVEGWNTGIEWRDCPTVEVNEQGEAI